MDFKYRVKDGKTWDKTALPRVLSKLYPGAKNAVDALKLAISRGDAQEYQIEPKAAPGAGEEPKTVTPKAYRSPYAEDTEEF